MRYKVYYKNSEKNDNIKYYYSNEYNNYNEAVQSGNLDCEKKINECGDIINIKKTIITDNDDKLIINYLHTPTKCKCLIL